MAFFTFLIIAFCTFFTGLSLCMGDAQVRGAVCDQSQLVLHRLRRLDGDHLGPRRRPDHSAHDVGTSGGAVPLLEKVINFCRYSVPGGFVGGIVYWLLIGRFLGRDTSET